MLAIYANTKLFPNLVDGRVLSLPFCPFGEQHWLAIVPSGLNVSASRTDYATQASWMIRTRLCLRDVLIMLHFLQRSIPLDVLYFSLPGLRSAEGVGCDVCKRVVNVIIVHSGMDERQFR
jgi:hypothetical protein